jgi:hypothetical protein
VLLVNAPINKILAFEHRYCVARLETSVEPEAEL